MNQDNFDHLISGILSPKVTGELEFESFSSIKDICERVTPYSFT